MTSFISDPVHGFQAYEQLRQEALAGPSGTGRGHGLALFVMRGMSAWLRALSALVPARPTEPASLCSVPALSPTTRSELTNVLADMVLACSQEAAR